MKLFLTILITFFLLNYGFSQDFEKELAELDEKLEAAKQYEQSILEAIEEVKLQRIQRDLQTTGLPAMSEEDDLIMHLAMALVYAEEHEQAKWVAHIITPDIIKGSVLRTNDFRVDPMVATGTAVEKDYFLKYLQQDSTYEYDGFGYDRGHLAPSADFRWSEKALSESYFYSNMSPQLPAFNREIWAKLENDLRGYIFRNPETQLYVVTGPVLEDDLPVIERGINKVSIPKQFWKVALDLKNQKAIGFLVPNMEASYPIESFAVEIDKIEEVTGIDFFHQLEDNLEDQLEKQLDKAAWIPELQSGNVEPIYPPDLPPNHFNTVQAKKWMGSSKAIHVCGTAVNTRISRKGNILVNFDKQFPNQIFTMFIRKEHIINFPYKPEEFLKDKKICVKGKVINLGGTPAIFVEDASHIDFMN